METKSLEDDVSLDDEDSFNCSKMEDHWIEDSNESNSIVSEESNGSSITSMERKSIPREQCNESNSTKTARVRQLTREELVIEVDIMRKEKKLLI